MVSWVWGLAAVIVTQRLLELRLAARNRRWLLAQGGSEFAAGHYPLFILLHGGWLMGWVTETLVRGPVLADGWLLWLTIFILAQGLRYWCISSLGRFWNTRILVLPGAKAVRRGPYRFLRHPNYLAVALELISVPLLFGAWMTAAGASLLNAWLLLGIRIPAEEKALAKLTE